MTYKADTINPSHTVYFAFILIGLTLFAFLTGCASSALNVYEEQRIKPYAENNWYWQYQGEPVLLLGGSDTDNLFNHPEIPPYGLEAHLDLLASTKPDDGGSSVVRHYVRNTMSSRDEGPNVWWFEKNEDSELYDMDNFNQEYWDRFENFLTMTADRDIIVQIELWDRFDYARDPWAVNPFNPSNNINFTAQEIGLPVSIDTHPGQNENPFFYSVPELENNDELLHYQQAIVDKMLEISLDFGHVLYCISNETNGSPLWGEYWANYLQQKANESGKIIEVTEMWDEWDLTDEEHGHTFNHPDLYSFVDISQNSHQNGQIHWDNMQKAREMLSVKPRPMNTVKIYGADEGYYHGTSKEKATRRLWRNMFGGLASSRFHRPPAGIGLDETARIHLYSAYLFLKEIDIFNAEPSNDILSERGENEAYGMVAPGNKYAVYFTDGGSVILDTTETDNDSYSVRWFNIMDSRWQEPEDVQYASGILLTAPGEGQWVALVTR